MTPSESDAATDQVAPEPALWGAARGADPGLPASGAVTARPGTGVPGHGGSGPLGYAPDDPSAAGAADGPDHRPPGRRAAAELALTRRDVSAAALVTAVLAVVGVAQGWLWSVVAPPELVIVLSDHSVVALPDEGQHRFDAMAMFLLIGLAVGLVAGIVAWWWRSRRGPLMVVGLAAGATLGAVVAMVIGGVLAAGGYPPVDLAAAAPGSVVHRGPAVESWWVVVAEPLLAALTYAVFSAWHGDDDLGRSGARPRRDR